MRIPVINKYLFSSNVFVERRLPSQGNLYVKKGDRVHSYDQIGQASFVQESEKIEYSGVLKKEEGDRVYPGDVLALESKLYFNKKEYNSTVSGRVKEINKQEKYILIEGLSRAFNLIAGVSGEVVDTLDHKSVLIKTSAVTVSCVAGSGEEVAGELVYVKGAKPVVTEKEIQATVAGKILLVNRIESGALKKAKTLGAVGFVIASCDYIDYKKYIEDGISVLIMEGFGSIPINAEIEKYFESFKSKFGILRTYDTMLLIPNDKPESIVKGEGKDLFLSEAKVGDTVQVFDSKYFGQYFKIEELKEKENIVVIKHEKNVVEIPADKVGLVV